MVTCTRNRKFIRFVKAMIFTTIFFLLCHRACIFVKSLRHKVLGALISPTKEVSIKRGLFLYSCDWNFYAYESCVLDTIVTIDAAFYERVGRFRSHTSDSVIPIDNHRQLVVHCNIHSRNVLFINMLYNAGKSGPIVLTKEKYSDTIRTHLVYVPDSCFDEYSYYKHSVNVDFENYIPKEGERIIGIFEFVKQN